MKMKQTCLYYKEKYDYLKTLVCTHHLLLYKKSSSVILVHVINGLYNIQFEFDPKSIQWDIYMISDNNTTTICFPGVHKYVLNEPYTEAYLENIIKLSRHSNLYIKGDTIYEIVPRLYDLSYNRNHRS